MKPRNTLVSIAVCNNMHTKVGNIVVPERTSRNYQTAEIVEVGPGMVTESGELSTTRDLRPGQKVLVQTHARTPNGLESIGVDFKTRDGRDLVLVEQSQIVAIVEEPENETADESNSFPRLA